MMEKNLKSKQNKKWERKQKQKTIKLNTNRMRCAVYVFVHV